METFVSAHPELADADRQMLLGWRDVVEGVFEIRERDGEAIIAVNLIDELTYWARRGSPLVQVGCLPFADAACPAPS